MRPKRLDPQQFHIWSVLAVTAKTKFRPIRRVLSTVTGKWQVIIVPALEDGSRCCCVVKRLTKNGTHSELTKSP